MFERGSVAERGLEAPARAAAADEFSARLDYVISRSQDYFAREQHAEGYWHRPLEANATMDAEYVFFMHFMGRVNQERQRRIVEHLLGTQADDGSWNIFPGAPGHVSTTIEAYFALKLAGLREGEPALDKARQFILDGGGIVKAGVFTRIFLAYFNQFSWAGVPSMPPEIVLLPNWFPLNIYEMSSWARGTVVPLTILLALKPRIRCPDGADIAELYLQPREVTDVRFDWLPGGLSWRNFFIALDKMLKLLGRLNWTPLRQKALNAAAEWIIQHQDWNGGWGGIQPAMINSVMALRALGYPDDHPVVARGIQGIEDFVIEEEGELFFQPCVSPVWDTALALRALLDSGVDPAEEGIRRAGNWLLAQQIMKPGDWSVKNPDLEPGGWAFEFANDWYPDTDDTAVILMVLRQPVCDDDRVRWHAIARGLNWTLGMQSRNGGWAAFDTDNVKEIFNQIPFADMEAMLDKPTADLTGRHLELMGEFGYDTSMRKVKRALEFVRSTQESDGSWWGRWGVNYIYGTWSVLCGLRSIGEDLRAPYVRRAVQWLKSHQNPDGGWGETCMSYADPSLAGKGESTPSQTAWAVLGLLAGEEGLSDAVMKGVSYLAQSQREDGTWEEEPFTGTGFPKYFYLRYYMYRNYFPLMALGQFRRRYLQEREVRPGNAPPRND